MAWIDSRGVRIHYEVEGSGSPVLLLHGLGASGDLNWRIPGWVGALNGSHRLILVDHRGHGQSEKPHRQAAYSIQLMAADALAVLDAEGVPKTALMGYSMGAMVAMELLLNAPARFSAAVLGGMGAMVAMELLLNAPARFSAAVLGGMGSRWPRRDGASRCSDVPTPSGAPPRRSQPRTGLRLLGSFLRHYDPIAQHSIRRTIFRGDPPVDATRLADIKVPVLVVAGSRDFLCSPSRELAAAIPGARHEVLPNRGHMGAVRDQHFKDAVKAFLSEVT